MNLSLIIPVYNVELYIESCLESVFNQTNIEETEIILVDDCGNDNSMDIARKVIEKYSILNNTKIVSHTCNQGLSAARNSGVKHAKGNYIFFLDSDDKLPENTINLFNSYLNQYGKVDFFIGNYIVDGLFDGGILKNTKTIYENREEIFNAYINNEWYVMACGKFINRLFFVNNDLWFAERRLHEDELFSFKLALLADKMVVIKEPIYRYIIRESSITSLKKEKHYIDLYWIINQKIRLLSTIKGEDKKFNVYIISILFQYVLMVSTSILSYKKQKVLIKWVRDKFGNIKLTQLPLKAKLEKHIITTYPIFLIRKIGLLINK